MSERAALKHVFDLARAPGLARKLRERPLPGGVLQVLRLAAGDEKSLNEVAAQTGRTIDSLRDAAQFYVVQVLFKPNADSYRVLGATSAATREELRTHMVWLLKYLHPDAAHGSPQSIFASRVTAAWESIKSVERREHYDIVRARPKPHGVRVEEGGPPFAAVRPSARMHTSSARAHSSRAVKARRRRQMLVVISVLAASVGGIGLSVWLDPGMLERANSAVFDVLRPTLPPQTVMDRHAEQ